MQLLLGLTLLLAACATSTFDAKRDPIVSAKVETRDRTSATLDFVRVAQLQDFISGREWRSYWNTLPAGYTGIEVKLSTKSGEKISLSIFRHEDGGGLFMRTPDDLFASSLSQAEMARFLEIVGSERPNQAPEPTTTLVTPRADARVAPSAVVAHL